jgi:hypothetical protein
MNLELIQSFGVDVLLTEQDDPLLWEQALAAHWKNPTDPTLLVEAMRFDIGRRLAEGEQPQDEINTRHASQRGLVDLEEWCFERSDSAHLRLVQCPPVPVQSFAIPLSISSLMTFKPTEHPLPAPQPIFDSLGISRPSNSVEEAVVYEGFSAPGVGQGTATVWIRQAEGSWVKTNQRTAWWIT